MVSRRYGLPLLRQRHHSSSIQNPKPEEMVELQANTVHRPMEATLSVEQRVAFRSQHCQVLYVPPGQIVAETGVCRDISTARA